MRGPKLRSRAARSGGPCAGHARLGRLAQPQRVGLQPAARRVPRGLRATRRRTRYATRASADGPARPARPARAPRDHARTSASTRPWSALEQRRPARAGPAARRLAREPARRLRGLGARGGAALWRSASARARSARASWAAASAGRCSPSFRPGAQPPGGRGQGRARTSRAASLTPRRLPRVRRRAAG